jgi:hypothetical protein
MTQSVLAATLKRTILNLQKTADLYAVGPGAEDHATGLRVLYVTGAGFAWRIIETQERTTESGVKRLCRMHCFKTLEKTRACLVERVAFRKAETSMIARYQARVAGESDPRDEVDEARERLRDQLCKTQPDRTCVVARVA